MQLSRQVTMNRRSLAYSGVLLLTLIVVSVLLNRGLIQGLDTNAHVSVSTDLSQYTLGQTIVIQGTLTFTADETAAIGRVRLTNTSGPQLLDVNLPVGDTGGVFMDLSSGVAGTLLVKVTFTGVSDIGGTLPGGTLPGSLPSPATLPGGGTLPGGATSRPSPPAAR